MSESVLSVKDLSVQYGSHKVLSNLSFEVNKGEIIGIVGESGCGKTTLLKALFPKRTTNLIISSGSILFEDQNLANADKKKAEELCGRGIGMIFQNPKASFNPIRTYKSQYIETLKSHGMYHKETFESLVLKTFERMNLTGGRELLESCPYEMSGGMNQRIAIALSILLKPRLLLLDEPTSALDVASGKLVMEELQRIRELTNTSIILVTHNMGLLSGVADKVGVINQGSLVEWGTVHKVFGSPEHSFTKTLLDAVPKLGIPERIEEENISDCILKLEEVSKEYKRKNSPFLALAKVGMEVKTGEILGVVGESGSGKSTLLNMIAGLCSPTDGSVIFKNRIMEKRRKRDDYCNVQMVFQHAAESFNPRHHIRKAMDKTLKNLCDLKSRAERNERINELMKRVDLSPDLADRYPWELSGGQCQRAAIARAISISPKLLLCDEITSALDVSVQKEIIDLLKKLVKETGMSVIFVSHDLLLVSSFCDTIMVLWNGECVEAAATRDIIKNPSQDYTKKLLKTARIDGSLYIGTD
ncbi:ABC transporter ATP-binding protein [Lacrimispora algidixylanolytica]|uniref:ABC transporter domain-containing protein n=1 Tax=Lacrimispora algidixylanolytica TaxID=94868 RepID=A0A419T7V2_9FIRM|nr:ABC transporter ATP-binding protein [Lacrimispora algidixylanolytica]RKD33667.1 hypothetical protein BET01_14160 [Lacrimispora algidixylanolytica]